MTIEFFGSKYNKNYDSFETTIAVNGSKFTAISFKGSVAYKSTKEISNEFIEKNKALLDGYLEHYTKTKANNEEHRKYENASIKAILPALATLKASKAGGKKTGNKKPAGKKSGGKNGGKNNSKKSNNSPKNKKKSA